VLFLSGLKHVAEARAGIATNDPNLKLLNPPTRYLVPLKRTDNVTALVFHNELINVMIFLGSVALDWYRLLLPLVIVYRLRGPCQAQFASAQSASVPVSEYCGGRA